MKPNPNQITNNPNHVKNAENHAKARQHKLEIKTYWINWKTTTHEPPGILEKMKSAIKRSKNRLPEFLAEAKLISRIQILIFRGQKYQFL